MKETICKQIIAKILKTQDKERNFKNLQGKKDTLYTGNSDENEGWLPHQK